MSQTRPFKRKEGNVLFNDALFIFVNMASDMVKDHSDSERKPAVATWATHSK